ncbi:MAG: peptidoglycan DD-metalloendopeptidase family protein [Defluviitaleaceae bacterium]|nr:peptidoglycan DD-metalloendopeptidase family protein [Defluviitaleaceae bacterium]
MKKRIYLTIAMVFATAVLSLLMSAIVFAAPEWPRWSWPVEEGTDSTRITSGIGERRFWLNDRWVNDYHTGIDIGGRNARGLNVIASRGGIVVHSYHNPVGGHTIIIEHENDFFSIYAHLDHRYVEIGDTVTQNQVIGILGNTGTGSAGPHLHFEIRTDMNFANRNGYLNPLNFVRIGWIIPQMYVSIDMAPVRPEPYAASGEIYSLHFGRCVNIYESHYNSHNNLWHLTPYGWIFDGNLSFPTTMYITRDDAPIRPRPYQEYDYNPESRLNTGSEVQVLRRIINTRNNVWYQLISGSWVYSGNLSYTRPLATIANGIYRIRSVASPSRVMGVSTWGLPTLNDNVTIFDDVGNGPTQHWRLESRGDAFVLHTSVSPLVLNAHRNNYAIAGTNVNVRNYASGASTQLWVIQDFGNGQFAIASQSNPNLVLTIAGTGNSARISTQLFNGSSSQLWIFERMD